MVDKHAVPYDFRNPWILHSPAKKRTMPVRLAAREDELLALLTRRVRVLSLEQIVRTFYLDQVDATRYVQRRLRSLSLAGWITVHNKLAHPELPLAGPLFEWLPDDTWPEFGSLSYQLRRRWHLPARTTTFVAATKLANRRIGGYVGGRQSRRSEVTHDLHLAAVYLWYRTYAPEQAKQWVSEQEQYALGGGRGNRLPDAIVRSSRSRGHDLIVEFGGAYSKRKLEEFHAAMHHVPYQIW